MRDRLATGRIARAGVLGKTMARIAAGEAAHRIKRVFLSAKAEETERASLDDANAGRLFEALSRLRGTATKLGQMLGMEFGLLPPAYVRELEKSFYRVPPLGRPLVRKAIISDLGGQPEELFAAFDFEAFSAASIGQVHAARLTDGREVAVKVQYPGVRDAIASDISMLRALAGPLPEAPLIRAALDEIEVRLTEETDYRQEAENTRQFRAALRTPGIAVPEVITERSGERVLTTTRMEGVHLDEWLAGAPPQETRDRAAQSLYDCLVEGVRVHGTAHVDPNPGNMLFRPDGTIALLDFGCVKRFSHGFRAALPRLLTAQAERDKAGILDAYADLGVPISELTDAFYEGFARPFGDWAAAPLRVDSFAFGVDDYSAGGMPFLRKLMQQDSFAAVAPDFVFFNRTIYGLMKIFERLGARVAIRDRWMES